MGKKGLQSLACLSKRVEQEGGEGIVICQENKCRVGREHKQLQFIARLCNELGCWTATVQSPLCLSPGWGCTALGHFSWVLVFVFEWFNEQA